MSNEIINLAKTLNKEDVIPKTSLQRNSIYYSLVSYINHTIAYFISENYTGVMLFIRRASKELNRLRGQGHEQAEYFTLCDKYIMMLSKHLIQNKLISDNDIDYFLSDVNQEELQIEEDDNSVIIKK